MNIHNLGWNDTFQQAFNNVVQTDWLPARVSSENRGVITLLSEAGELTGTIAGRLRNQATSKSDFPVVGDWVCITANLNQQTATIHTILPRQTTFSRKTAGTKTEQQILSANIDYVFIITGLDHNFNIRRIERYLNLAWNSCAQPIVILNKADIINSRVKDEITTQLSAISLTTTVHFISALTGNGISELKPYFTDHKTAALLGSSGVGKSTLTNLLLGKTQQKTAEIRAEDSKGRHTTTTRQLFVLPTGGLIIDTPGMRELQLWLDEEESATGFKDVEELAQDCKFYDCTHDVEPNCAVKAAIAAGKLDPKRLENYRKMQRELKHLATKQQETNWQTRKEQRQFGKMCRDIMKAKKNK
jgi:ribosome biogenesis GTPase / thiamine phosphate phosphatase